MVDFNPIGFLKRAALYIWDRLKALGRFLLDVAGKVVVKLDTWIWNKRWNKRK